MKLRHNWLGTFFLLALLFVGRVASGNYDVIDLGMLPNFNHSGVAFGSQGLGIDNAGQATGRSDINVNNVLTTHGFFWNGNTLTDLDSPSSTNNTFVQGMGPAGQVVGQTGGGFAFVWTQAVGFNNLPMPTGKFDALASGMNTLGDVVGYSADSAGSLQLTTVWKSSGGIALLNPVNSFFFSTGQGINSSRTVAGDSFDNLTSMATVWNYNVGTDQWTGQALGTLGGNFSHAADINNLGNIVGNSTRASGQGRGAFIWHPGDQTLIDLDPTRAFSGLNTFAKGINDENEVVGSIAGGGAFVWDQTHGIRDLQMLIDPNSLFTLTDAAHVNDNGWIIGTANDSGDGLSHAVILKPELLKGDFNLDGQVTIADVQAGMDALANLENYQSTNHLSDADLLTIADVNGVGGVTNSDIQSLISVLATGSGGGSLIAVPEPMSARLILLAGLLAPVILRRQLFTHTINPPTPY